MPKPKPTTPPQPKVKDENAKDEILEGLQAKLDAAKRYAECFGDKAKVEETQKLIDEHVQKQKENRLAAKQPWLVQAQISKKLTMAKKQEAAAKTRLAELDCKIAVLIWTY